MFSTGFGDLDTPDAARHIRTGKFPVLIYGGCAWETFGSAGFRVSPVRQPTHSCHPFRLATIRGSFSPLDPENCTMDENYLTPHIFTRHKLHLHALLLENQPWFSARDLGRLLRLFLDERALRKLDPDQHQTVQMLIHGAIENTLLISESGVYALLIYHYCPEYRGLREWLTHDVVPALRDAQQPSSTERPILSLLNWPEMSLSLLHWNNQPWIRLQDVPQILPDREQPQHSVNAPWWKRASRILQAF
jgi:prophage antirepressor-like protein